MYNFEPNFEYKVENSDPGPDFQVPWSKLRGVRVPGPSPKPQVSEPGSGCPSLISRVSELSELLGCPWEI